ncbi:MAG TPA: hypothetical protein VET23_01250 [Chitinophagaceae bacterium]|nr:hypothetical protein [Chitinophagaceae bacterium]
MKKILSGSLILFLAPSVIHAQSDSTEGPGKAQFKLGVYYNSTLNYYGRTDSLRSSGFFPIAELWFTKNFYINAAPVFVNNSAASFQYAGTIATVGYQFNNNDKLNGNIYFVKPFYQSNSQLVESALKEQVAFTLTAQNKFLNVTGETDVKFSDNIDFGLTAGLDHIFRFQFDDESVFVIDPSAYLYMGTQQFTKSYLKKAGGFLIFPGTDQLVTQSSQKFSILSYEFSLPLIFAKGKFTLLATPAYVIPENLITVPGRPDLSERGKKMFYATIGAKVAF